ncbi:MAG: hypothetical protein AAF383_01910 [Cyanobacteria bacterium P01_A01_bin.83]
MAFNTIGFQKNYFFPSNPFSLVLFRYFNPFNWFEPANHIDIIDRFIKGELNQKSISVKKYFHSIDIIFPGLIILLIAILPYYIIVVICFTLSLESTYEFNHKTKRLIVKQKKLFGQRVERQHSFDQIKQVKLDPEYKTNFNYGRIILEFDPSYDYPIDEFTSAELGVANFQIIKDFLENEKRVLN